MRRIVYMDISEIQEIEKLLESFFNSATGRRKTVNIQFVPDHGRRGTMYINDEVGVEDELQHLQTKGFSIYTVKPASTGKFEDNKVGIDMKVPEPTPTSI